MLMPGATTSVIFIFDIDNFFDAGGATTSGLYISHIFGTDEWFFYLFYRGADKITTKITSAGTTIGIRVIITIYLFQDEIFESFHFKYIYNNTN